MSIAAEPFETPPLWQPLHETVVEFRSGCTQLERHFEDLFAEVDQLRDQLSQKLAELDRQGKEQSESREALAAREVELAEHEAQLAQENSQLEAARSEFEEQSQRRQGELEQQQLELQRQREELTREAEDAGEHVAECVRLREHVTAMEADLIAANSQLEAIRQELVTVQTQASADAEERDTLRTELARLEQQRDELASEPASGAIPVRSHEQNAELVEAHREIENLRQLLEDACHANLDEEAATANDQELAQLIEERDALEAELERVRSHAAELDQTVVEQQHQIDSQQTTASDELSQLRRLVERQSDLIDRGTVQADAVKNPPTTTSREPVGDDPVVNSVMAQFAKLQRDVASRRRKKERA